MQRLVKNLSLKLTPVNKCCYFKLISPRSTIGFTIIELIVTLMMVSIMAATVLPRFLTSKGVEEYTYRDELVTKLRSIQLRIMQQTGNSTCRTIAVKSNKQIGLLATTVNTTDNECETTLAGNTELEIEHTSVTISNDHAVTFSVSENLPSFSFSQLGRPTGCLVISPCEITFTISGTGTSSLTVKINQEGYIYVP